MEAVVGDAQGRQNFRWEMLSQEQHRGKGKIDSRTREGKVGSAP